MNAIRKILNIARDAQSSLKNALAKRFAKLLKPAAALCSLPIVLAALEDLVAPQRLGDKAAATSSETGSIAGGTDNCSGTSNGESTVGMNVTDHAPTGSNGVSFAAHTTEHSTANSAAHSSGSASFLSLSLLEGEELLQSSPIPSSIVEVGDGVTRKWSLQDLASNTTEDNVAKIIGGGCFGEVIYYSRMHSTAAIDTLR